MKNFICLLIGFLFLANLLSAQYFDCYIEPDTNYTATSGCGGTVPPSGPELAFFRSIYLPSANQPIKVIPLHVHVMQNDTGGLNFDSVSVIQNFFNTVNYRLDTIFPPSDPVASVCGSCHNYTDSRFRVVVKSINFTNQRLI